MNRFSALSRSANLVIVLGWFSGSPNVYADLDTGVGVIDFVGAYKVALTQNGDYQAQLYRYKASKSDVWAARSALLPQLSIQGSYGAVEEFRDVLDGPFNGRPVGVPDPLPEPEEGESTPEEDEAEEPQPLEIGGLSLQGRSVPIEDDYETGTVSLNLEQTLFDRKKWTTIGRSKSLREEQRLELLETREALILDLVAAYTGVLGAQDRAEISQRELAALGRHRDLTLQRYREGLGTLTDSHESESRYQLVLADSLQNDFEINQFQNRLTVLLGEQVARVSPLHEDFNAVTSVTGSDDYIVERPSLFKTNDVLLAEQRVRSARYQAKNANADFWPTLSLVGSSRYTRETFSLLTTDNENYRNQVMLQLEVPLFAGFGTFASSRAARHELYASKAGAKISRDRAIANFMDSEANFRASYQRLLAFERANQSSQHALALRQKGYLEGLSSNLDLLDALRDSFRTERSYRTAIYDYLVRYFDYVASHREITDSDIEFLNSYLVPINSGDLNPNMPGNDGASNNHHRGEQRLENVRDGEKIAYEEGPLVVQNDQPEPSPSTKPKSISNDQEEVLLIKKMVKNWLESWESTDIESYLEVYSPSFIPANGVSLVDWKNERIRRLTSATEKQINLKNMEIQVARKKMRATVLFQQIYRSDQYSDSMLKKLVLEKVNSQWKIMSESRAEKGI